MAGACAQATKTDEAYTPSVGQEGKDAVWVPTPDTLANAYQAVALVKNLSGDYTGARAWRSSSGPVWC